MQCGLEFSKDFRAPRFGYMAVRASCANSGAIVVVSAFPVFGVDIDFHFMTGNAKCLCTRHGHGCIEATPKNNSKSEHREAADRNSQPIPLSGSGPKCLSPTGRQLGCGLFPGHHHLTFSIKVPLDIDYLSVQRSKDFILYC